MELYDRPEIERSPYGDGLGRALADWAMRASERMFAALAARLGFVPLGGPAARGGELA